MIVTIIDYGLGNLWSVKNAFEYIGAQVQRSSKPDVIKEAECLVLPGVGSFATGMKNLTTSGLDVAIKSAVNEKKASILGICLGMQLLANSSEEGPGVNGLGLIEGEVVKLKGVKIRLPHMGFNTAFSAIENEGVFPVLTKSSDFYFVHSYCFSPKDPAHILTYTEYGEKFVSGVKKDNILGVQFHPEKSQSKGLEFLRSFLDFSKNNRD